MSFRARLTLALVAIALVPLAILGYGMRREMTARLDADAARRVDAVRSTISATLTHAIAADRARLQSLASELADDNRFRIALANENSAERKWLLDWAPGAMKLSGFAMLQLQDSAGRVLSSGQFRNDFDRVAPALPGAIATSQNKAAVVDARTADGTVRALAAIASLTGRGERYTLVGGARFDSARVAQLSNDATVAAQVVREGAPLPDGAVAVLTVPYVDETATDGGARAAGAELILVPDSAPTRGLKSGLTRWLVFTLGGTLLIALVAATLLGRAVSAPIDEFVLRSARETERAAATGDLARQVNHDIKNGLAPIRNVLRHLGQTAERDPATLAAIYLERRATLERSVEYLDELARTYAKLSPALTGGATDPRAVIMEVARGVSGATLDVTVPDVLPKVRVDAVVLRRVLDNLVSNAVDALEDKPGRVTISAEARGKNAERRVRISVADTGRGMTREQLDHAFDDFYTTKATGTGLGLSVVRRLLTDVGGSVRAETAPGEGSTFTVEIPAAERQ